MLQTEKTALPGVLLLKPDVCEDRRGSFSETWNEEDFRRATGLRVHFCQDNESVSFRGVIRGLHYQNPPCAQAKLVRCAEGRVFDVAVDLRRSSPTFGRWTAHELSEENAFQIWIPAGFAHGFAALSDRARLCYKTDAPWSKESEGAVRWDDPALGILWPDAGVPPVLSEKDLAAPPLSRAVIGF